MNFAQLHHVKAIAETGSITKAATLLHITQSALSQSISNLETSLGIKLFQRQKSGTTLTPLGKNIYPLILDMLEQEENLYEKIDTLNSNMDGSLSIATVPSLFMTIVPSVLAAFKRDNPNIDVQITEAENHEVRQSVVNGEVDIGLYTVLQEGDLEVTGAHYAPLFSSGFTAIVPKDSKLAYLSKLSLSDIKGFPFILYDRNFYKQNIKKFEEKNNAINLLFSTNNVGVLFNSVAEGLGMSILSDLMVESTPFYQRNMITTVPIGAPFNQMIEYGVLYMEDSEKQKQITEFAKYLVDAAKSNS
ncbi:LysR family transcriptional regulator [Staphylococcus sp. IVB6181]|uniref:LysR family transcriptional regulator n=1 Tax=Staphylococcus sp. IVB6181 TaxID=2929481 RepID=UPI0021D033B2|nr:LysR family transcriptional regulator [Staphylococcus sp. IVB6181]UXV34877.1 LysR family transcriptional regulator [Staphylococcus sp. IVB6181]